MQKKDVVSAKSGLALLCIDCQERFRGYLSNGALEPIIDLVQRAHEAQVPVIFTQHSDVDPTSVLSRHWQKDIVFDSADWQLLPELPVQDGDGLIQDKHTYDSFMQTGLEAYLRERGITTLAIVGAMTNLCCETTVRSAFTRNFDVLFLTDANATSSLEMHAASLLNLEYFGCRLLSSRDFLASYLAEKNE